MVAHRLSRSALARRTGGVVLLAVVAWRMGIDQSLRAVGAIDARALGAALVLTGLTTVCCAWRWSLVATGIGARVPLRTAVADCYRSQFLNTATPGGVLGDVHRGVRHGRRTADAGRGVRSVVWERTAGQVVQGVMALIVLSVLPSPVRPVVAWGWAAAAVALVCTVLRRRVLRRTVFRRTVFRRTVFRRTGLVRGPRRRVRTGVVADSWREVRRGVLSRRTWPLVAIASALAVTGHVLTFLVAARTAGSTASATGLVPLAFVVLMASGIPTNLAGWGPREGVAAWVFGAAGLGAGAGLSTAVVYGVLVLVASLPGAVVLVVTHVRPRPPSDVAPEPVVPPATTRHTGEVLHG
jgi:glycosyltransferase 2 family protein